MSYLLNDMLNNTTSFLIFKTDETKVIVKAMHIVAFFCNFAIYM